MGSMYGPLVSSVQWFEHCAVHPNGHGSQAFTNPLGYRALTTAITQRHGGVLAIRIF